ncbi:cardiolipin synthase [Sutcliffiella deserti]|uniref:cardiolipin synthase n=1 Tax=Sutcliffiella deserti TaxID=2875501 RepID=UPI001CBFC0DE|nr:cardiolipin synthase [Sutcliffiella deserti]
MEIILYIVIALLIIIAWVLIDFSLGRKNHLKNLRKKEFPKRNSDFTLYTDGNKLYEDLFDEMKNASNHIHTFFYMVNDDHVSEEYFTILKNKADEGVEVRLLMDYLGSHKVKKKKVEELRSHGITAEFCQKPSFPYLFFSINQRNHRKITVIDGKIGYLGGFNIGKEYLGQDPKFGVWRDYHLKFTGEGVQDLQTQFFENWTEANPGTSQDYQLPNYYPPLAKGKSRHQLVPTNGRFLEDTFQGLIRRAQKSIIICTPYFIPNDELFDELLQALNRGVKVTILLPEKADHILVRDAAFLYFPALLKAGADVHFFYLGFYHAKVMVIDEEMCDIGTANFDKRSLYLNNELNCLIFDPEFVQSLIPAIQKDIHNAEKLTYEFINERSIFDKGKEQVARLVAPLL